MSENRRIVASTAEIFTLSLLFVSAFNLALRGNAEEMRQLSALFALCGEGLTLWVLGELLLLSVLISLLRYVWFSQRVFPNMLMINRITFMLVSVFVTSGLCAAVFRWFPLDMWEAWLGFVGSFSLATAVSFGVMVFRTGRESRRYQQTLAAYNGKCENAAEGTGENHDDE